ncbi:ATP-binding protein [Bdellovibrionota bacterium FG-2]
MNPPPFPKLPKNRGASLRHRILFFVGALILISLCGSTLSLFRITEVSRMLDQVNHTSVPIGRLLSQVQTDVEVFRSEIDRSLGQSHWKDPHWKPHAVPRWIQDVLQDEVQRIQATFSNSKPQWQNFAQNVSESWKELQKNSVSLAEELEQKDDKNALELYAALLTKTEDWKRQLAWGAAEFDRGLRQDFNLAETRVSQLRTGLEIVLAVVVMLSLLLLWLGESALRPLADLTRFAREITRRGLRKEDKSILPEIPLSRSDEVSQLSREFRRMATALLEREKTVEHQKVRLQDQNRLLRDIGALNENILHSIESVLIVMDLDARITQCNPTASLWLQTTPEKLIGSHFSDWPRLSPVLGTLPGGLSWIPRMKENPEGWKISRCAIEGRIFGGQLLPLRSEKNHATGALLIFADITEEIGLGERLRRAEDLAAIGRLSAQVAHEVRNPLHSIGLEAELASEQAASFGALALKQSLDSILTSVDRLQKITENYLKLSRLSTGNKTNCDLRFILNSVLATYGPVCEAQSVRIETHPSVVSTGTVPIEVFGDRDLLEQVFGNLLRNALQAIESQTLNTPRVIRWEIGIAESGRVWVRISDSGPGVSDEVKGRLFVPFVTTRAQGTGLGLSFIKKVIEDHGGTISYVDGAPSLGAPNSQGACFEILLPSLSAHLARTQPFLNGGEDQPCL